MNNLQIDQILRNTQTTKSGYLGCFSADNIPMGSKVGFMVVNVASNGSAMGHWVMFYSNGKRAIFFDSFGLSPNIYLGKIAKYYNSFEYGTAAIEKAIQNSNSYVCGAYCIYYIYYLSKNTPLSVINRRFSHKTKLGNDKRVEKFIMKLANRGQICIRDMCTVSMFNTKCQIKCKCL
jgi:hypothetical protein